MSAKHSIFSSFVLNEYLTSFCDASGRSMLIFVLDQPSRSRVADVSEETMRVAFDRSSCRQEEVREVFTSVAYLSLELSTNHILGTGTSYAPTDRRFPCLQCHSFALS